MTHKRIVLTFEDETGTHIVSHILKHEPRIGATATLNGTTFVIERRRASSTKIDFWASPERLDVQEFSAEEVR